HSAGQAFLGAMQAWLGARCLPGRALMKSAEWTPPLRPGDDNRRRLGDSRHRLELGGAGVTSRERAILEYRSWRCRYCCTRVCRTARGPRGLPWAPMEAGCCRDRDPRACRARALDRRRSPHSHDAAITAPTSAAETNATARQHATISS